MKLVRFSAGGGKPRLGVHSGAHSGKSVAAIDSHIAEAPTDMIELIERWDELGPKLAAIDTFEFAHDEVKLLAPVARPGKILGIGLNYADHAAEAGVPVPTEQMWFSMPVTAVNGPFDPIQRPIVSTALDYEAELVVVIGKRSRHLSKDDAGAAIFGYCAGNDVSVRDWQLKTSQVMLGKSFDTHAPFGPWIVTADELDPSDLSIASYVNGEQRQGSRTSQLIFDCTDQVSLLSKVMTLEPGDLLYTGTPDGVGAVRKPPLWLAPGDVVRVEIEGIGAIENRVIDEAAV